MKALCRTNIHIYLPMNSKENCLQRAVIKFNIRTFTAYLQNDSDILNY